MIPVRDCFDQTLRKSPNDTRELDKIKNEHKQNGASEETDSVYSLNNVSVNSKEELTLNINDSNILETPDKPEKQEKDDDSQPKLSTKLTDVKTDQHSRRNRRKNFQPRCIYDTQSVSPDGDSSKKNKQLKVDLCQEVFDKVDVSKAFDNEMKVDSSRSFDNKLRVDLHKAFDNETKVDSSQALDNKLKVDLHEALDNKVKVDLFETLDNINHNDKCSTNECTRNDNEADIRPYRYQVQSPSSFQIQVEECMAAADYRMVQPEQNRTTMMEHLI